MFKKLIVSVVLACATSVVAQTACSSIDLGSMAALNGFVPSPNDAWHQDISTAPVDPLSSKIMTSANDLGGGRLHADFGSIAGGNHGIPYTVVDSQTTPGIQLPILVNPAESDMTLVAIPTVLPVESSPPLCPTEGTHRHAIIIDRNQCVMYEIYQAANCNNAWTGSNIALWDLATTEKRPYGYTSADSAGLSVFEGLIRYDEIVAGVINHAIRFTTYFTKNNPAGGLFTAPATHADGMTTNTDNIMGMRLRLKANYDISHFSTTNQIILMALKKYGMILADNGSNMYLGGTPDARWNDADLGALGAVVSSGLEVVQMGPQYDATTAPQGVAPVITSFTASATTIPAGGSVTLTPTVTGASYSYIDNAGFVRGPVTVSPAATTTYTLTSRNEFGSTSASVTVTVGGTQTAPTLTFAPVPTQTFGVAPFAVSASSQSNGAITYSIASGPATISGSTVTVTGIGTVVVDAAQAAAGTYGAGTATTSFTVLAANPGLAFVPIPDLTFTSTPLTVSSTTSSTGSITYSVLGGPATISGNKVTLTGNGTVSLQANQAAAGNYLAGVATTSFNVTGGLTIPTLVFTSIPTQTIGVLPFAVHAGSASTGAVVYSVVSGPATVLGNLVTVTGAGTVVLRASQAAAGTFGPATATTSFVVQGLQLPALVFTTILDLPFTSAPFTVSASSASLGAITYSVVSGPATISGNRVTLTGAGRVVLQASQAAWGVFQGVSVTTSFQALGSTFVGGRVSIPTPSSGLGSPGFYLHVTQTGTTYLMNHGLTSDPHTGLWFANASACEASPTTCAWTALRTGEPASGGSYSDLQEMVDIDSTHELGIFGFSAQSGGCGNCSIQILNTVTKTYKPITLPGQPAGESPACMARDSSGIFYTMLNYHAGIWKSTDNTAASWTRVTPDYSTLPGLAGAGGNIYTCTVYGPRIYFGGEGGVISCNLSFSSCSQDYLPFGTGKRNFTGILADVDGGSPNSPTMMLMCCKQNATVAGYVPLSRFSGGAWTQLTTSSGLPQYGQEWIFETSDMAVGTGAARRYYEIFSSSNPTNVAYKSTDSTGTSFALFSPPQWPTATASYTLRQMTPDPRNGAVWALFTGTSGLGVYVTP